jgi:hypothetical protein
MFLYDLNNGVGAHLIAILHKSDIVTHTKLVLQIHACPTTNHFPITHNTDAVSKIVSLIHKMGSQDDGSIIFVCL